MRNHLIRAWDTIGCHGGLDQPIGSAVSEGISFPPPDWRAWNAVYLQFHGMSLHALSSHYFCLCLAEYDSDTSCHYKMELSYENFITSGPDPHPPPIADDESDDDDDDDIPRVRNVANSASRLEPKTRSCHLHFETLPHKTSSCFPNKNTTAGNLSLLGVLNHFCLCRRITMPSWSKPGKPKFSLQLEEDSVMRLRGNLGWIRLKELYS